MALTVKVALVTGGCQRYGACYCPAIGPGKVLRSLIFDLNDDGLASTSAESDNIHAYRCDIANQQEVNEKVAQVASDLGPIDRLVHAAALMPSRSLEHHAPDDVMRLMQINYAGTLYMIHSILPSMLERNAGEMLIFGSIAGQALVPRLGAYCATKAAVNTYVETMQNELAHTKLDIFLVCPPAVNTPLVDQTLEVDTPGKYC